MDIVYRIAKYVVGIEFVLILLIILMTLLLKFFFFNTDKKEKKIRNEIKAFLKKQNPNFDDFKKNWRNFDLLMPVVSEFEHQVDSHWENIRIKFFQAVLLPLARSNVTSKEWTARFYASKSFSLFFEDGDELYILKLAEDTIPLVRYNAIIAAVLYGSEKCIKVIIARMTQEPSLSQFIYLREFYNASGTSRIHIENCLIDSNDPKVRNVCYKLLINYPALGTSWDYKNDISSSNLQLKLASLTYLSHADRALAIPILTNSLHDGDWQVRVATLVCLRNLKAYEAITNISECLNDSNQSVVLVAKHVLYEFEEPGKQALKSHDITYEPTALDIENRFMFI